MNLKHNLPSADYHAIKAASSSSLKLLRTNQLKFINQVLVSPYQTGSESMLLGELVHCLLLTPDEYKEQFVVVDANKRTKEGKAILEQMESDPRIKVKNDVADKADLMAKSVLQVPLVKGLLDHPESLKELSFFWQDQLTKEDCKCRWDCVNPELGIILDIKTTKSGVSSGEFAKTIINYYYEQQAAFYLDAAKIAFGREHFSFCFVAIDSNDPHDVALYVLDDAAIDLGRNIYRENLSRYACIMNRIRCQTLTCTSQLFEDKQFETISLPQWAHDLTKR